LELGIIGFNGDKESQHKYIRVGLNVAWPVECAMIHLVHIHLIHLNSINKYAKYYY
jgi:hypothetical protein